jgi:hypothetical protein
MRIHTNIAGLTEIGAAARYASEVSGGGVTVHLIGTHASRSHAHAFEIRLTGDGTLSRRRSNSGRYGADSDAYAATYDQWGHFLFALYAVDPDIKAGPYTGVEDFDHQTSGKFSTAHAST